MFGYYRRGHRRPPMKIMRLRDLWNSIDEFRVEWFFFLFTYGTPVIGTDVSERGR